MSVLLTGNVWNVSPRVMCGDDYAILSWREVMVKRPAVRRQEINNNKLEYQVLIMQSLNDKIASYFTEMKSDNKKRYS